MFCASCGNQLNAALKYCSRCGTQISKVDAKGQKSVAKSFSETLGYIGGFGFIGFIFVILILVKNAVTENTLIFISFFYLAALLIICLRGFRYLKSLLESSPAEKDDLQDYVPPAQIGAKNTAQLEDRFEPIGSVTDETTRHLEKVPLKMS